MQTTASEDDLDDDDNCSLHLRTSLSALEQLIDQYSQSITGDVDIVWSALIQACRTAVSKSMHEGVPGSLDPHESTATVWYIVNLMTMCCSCPAIARCWHQLLVARIRRDVFTDDTYNSLVAEYLASASGDVLVAEPSCPLLISPNHCLCDYNTLTMGRLFGYPLCVHLASCKPPCFDGSYVHFSFDAVKPRALTGYTTTTSDDAISSVGAQRTLDLLQFGEFNRVVRDAVRTVAESPALFATHLPALMIDAQRLADTVASVCPLPLRAVISARVEQTGTVIRTLFGKFPLRTKRPRSQCAVPDLGSSASSLQPTSLPKGRPKKKPKKKHTED